MNEIKLSLIIPCYNEEKNISLIINKLRDYLNKRGLEFIFVDNGSSDKTKSEILKYSKQYKSIKLIIIQKNIGYGNGIFQGLKSAKGEYIGWTHGDIQTPPIDALRALDIIRKENFPKNIFVKGKRYGRPLVDKLVNTLGMSIFETLILRKRMYDINAQPNIFHRSLLSKMKSPPLDFSFDLYVYYLAKFNKYKVRRFPVFFGKRIFGESKWNTGWKARIKFIKRTIKFTFELKKRLKKY
jgi:glycosyltransferase involved in cell wall biosynthesis